MIRCCYFTETDSIAFSKGGDQHCICELMYNGQIIGTHVSNLFPETSVLQDKARHPCFVHAILKLSNF